ncbi:MAG: M20/M25/M40 family metallo-hydrolase [Caldilineaceae bacterium]|nr:M20/M25/M40 family metallo-hydrolase [Caldilineaceae bacterium]
MERKQEQWTALKEAVDGEWIAQMAQALVEIPSVTLQEAEVCRFYAAQLDELGFAVDRREVSEGRYNLYARLPGGGNGPSLMLNGHLDTIPVGDCEPCRREGDRLYGRGSTDMKGAMAAVLGALRALKTAGITLNGDLWLSAIVGHEQPEAGKDGPLALVEDYKSGRVGGDRILIAEGWNELWVMSMGTMVFTIELTSPRGGTHTTYVPFEENPIRFVGDLIQRITAYQEELDAGASHPLAGTERIDLGMVEAGDYFNRTPVQCRLTGTVRWGPRACAEEVLAELRQLAAPIAEAGQLELEVSMFHEREPFETAGDDPAVQAVARAHRFVHGDQAILAGKRIVGDANLFVNLGGVPSFYYGPSNETAHSDGEWVSLTRLEQAAQVYALAAAAYCGLNGAGE